MELLMIFLLDYILKFYYFRQAFLHNRNHDLCISLYALLSLENKLKKHVKICRDRDFCYVKMPDENSSVWMKAI